MLDYGNYQKVILTSDCDISITGLEDGSSPFLPTASITGDMKEGTEPTTHEVIFQFVDVADRTFLPQEDDMTQEEFYRELNIDQFLVGDKTKE